MWSKIVSLILADVFFLTLCLRSDSWTSIYIINGPSLSERSDLARHNIKTSHLTGRCSAGQNVHSIYVACKLGKVKSSAFSFVYFNSVQRSHKHLKELSHTGGRADLKSCSFFAHVLKTWHLLSLLVVSLLKVKMSVLAESFECVHFINEFQEYTNVGLGGYMI